MNRRIDDIEVLRAVAVLFVVLQHAQGNLFSWSSPALEWFYTFIGGSFGVDLFFAISGFVIARDLLPRLQASGSRRQAWYILLAFWVRRAWRLWPSAWLWLAVILGLCWGFNQSGVFGSLRANAEATLAALLQVANVRFALTFGEGEIGVSFVYWSLSLEEQFYLLFPLLALLGRRYVLPVVLALIFLQCFAPRLQSLWLMMLRTDALAYGILIAMIHERFTAGRVPAWLHGRHLSRLLLVLALLCLTLLASRLPVPSFSMGLIALLCAGLVWMAAYDANLICPPGLLKRLLIWIGNRSYAIYLIHVPAFFFTRELFYRLYPEEHVGPAYFFPYLVVSVGLILMFSELNYRWVESPFRRFGARQSRILLIQGRTPETMAVLPAERI
ncbi:MULTISPECIES: acyltransferase family protein [Pseudomonas aeruginosa group]|uniref:Acyltransferase family protein n=1 Tax=Pseudomonas paraeruginosa TaxID=2994495 RepID=A0A2R3ILJ4_9PSED|nr:MULTISPECIES: acyltransferase [Pseudomonas aeruginosa group]VTS49218.1 O-acetyltransferase OatA [Streptococcus dysgalactiae subsp. equisimilis]AVK02761.1 acyltransferase family protein [Pseudomonas paraeruginosa]AVR70616.1 acyltransferase [Pseudomonas paraeruginosa]AWE91001.1 acyltransferase family protein [Pseudomonas paraeruginosa]KAB0751889.1 acyltransferase [Pseudomonas aeruginosa]